MKRNEDYMFMFQVACDFPVAYCGFLLGTYCGDVEGQTTSQREAEGSPDVAKRINRCHTYWENSLIKPVNFHVFERYEIRHYVWVRVRSRDYVGLRKFLAYLSNDVLDQFSMLERWLWRSKIAWIQKTWLAATKLVWRLRGFPRLKMLEA